MKMKAIFVTVSNSENNIFGIFYCLGLLFFPLFEFPVPFFNYLMNKNHPY